MSRRKKRSLEADLVESLLSGEDESSEVSDILDAPVSVVSLDDDRTIAPSGEVFSAEAATVVQDVDSDKTQVVAESGYDSPQNLDESEDTVQVSPGIQESYDPGIVNTANQESTFLLAREETQRFSPVDMPGSLPSSGQEEIKFGRVASDKSVIGGGSSSSVELSLSQSESLRVAQNRILGLEEEVERVRQENEQLIAAGETIRRKSDSLRTRVEKAEMSLKEERAIFKEEKKIYRDNLEDKERENQRIREKLEELEIRLDSDLKKIRVRERELENRLELVKMEEAALLRNKDEIILDLKRKIDQLNSELDNFRGRSLELHKNMEQDQERQRRTVRALRLALTMLEDSESEVTPLKKVD